MVTFFRRRSAPTPLVPSGVLELVRRHLAYQRALLDGDPGGRPGLTRLHDYLAGQQPHPSVPAGATPEILAIAKQSKVNILDLIVSAVAQSMYVDGYRVRPDQGAPESNEDAPAWEIWQANKMDAAQAAIHRAALAYGWAYATVLPGDPLPVIRGWSPRYMIALYGSDPEWPVSALSLEPGDAWWDLQLYDDKFRYTLRASDLGAADLDYIAWDEHGADVVPVIRYQNVQDLDEDNMGELERLLPIQDQINDTTFDLRVAQKYAAFRQRYILGWTATSEEEKLKAAASRLWLFEDPDVKVGEFEQTQLSGYLDSRESSLRHAASLSQTPAHELIGQLVNLSAEALVAAEASQRRKVTERQMSFGESHEQMFSLAARLAGMEIPAGAQVRWKDTESRAFSATVDALTKLKTIGVPIELILERVPGFTQADVERALAIIAERPPAPAPSAAGPGVAGAAGQPPEPQPAAAGE